MEPALWTDDILRYFKPSEFDSPDSLNSGYKMDYGLIQKLLDIRRLVGRPFIVTSGFRTKEYNQQLKERGYKASPDSAHLKGMAADIKILDSRFLYSILQYSFMFRFKRIGLGNGFLHLDNDSTKEQQKVIWTYYD